MSKKSEKSAKDKIADNGWEVFEVGDGLAARKFINGAYSVQRAPDEHGLAKVTAEIDQFYEQVARGAKEADAAKAAALRAEADALDPQE